ncbi:MAG: glycerol dehydratase reactivase beta/small subunit family protein, partial [Eubacterium sp.]|nr:glycerol dehydratase reactivase beta/small subunit family protein [Eubacterium sp.]
MSYNEDLVKQITAAVIAAMRNGNVSSEEAINTYTGGNIRNTLLDLGGGPAAGGAAVGRSAAGGRSSDGLGPDDVPSMAGRMRINEAKTDYSSYPAAAKGTDPKEVVIGVGAAFQREIRKTIGGIPLENVLKNVKAGIEEEGMIPRVVKILDTSDVGFMALESAKLSGSGIGIGIQS